MTKAVKIVRNLIIGFALITMISAIGVYGLIIFVFSAENVEEYESKQALSSLQIRFAKGNISNAYVATSTYWHDYNYYARFNAKADFIEKFIVETKNNRNKLQEEPIDSKACQIILSEKIRLSWWNPQEFDVDKCYSDKNISPGTFSVLLYHPESRTAFYYHHNN
ncbi:hypothetical protein Riv7116_5206 [Rivularia sp. PCC 7116]|uniref:hypothetical protein n=1 Tax=Rivularia sp. PCC 7116 TaxID=373994 RepID=UPI00029F1F24|nr:hypothetical protein [Rivularia sp. PCC 7116]AFY57601.1 hypothetical protein Riv7116_5206 [Rivularia sp. PCC 7116]